MWVRAPGACLRSTPATLQIMPDTRTATTLDHSPGSSDKLPALLVLALLLGVLVYAFREALAWSWFEDWPKDEYNHCYLIPLVAGFMIATRARELAAVPWTGSLPGLIVLAAGFLMLLLGQMSSVITLSQYGFVVAVWGCFIAVLGWPAVRTIWPALAYLAFMVAVPDFIEVKLSAGLQLISTRLGVAVIRLAEIPVYVEGNVIDLGNFQLAVVEACSGLRYLFPLLSFGFLCAAIFVAPLWQRSIVFLSAIPLTVLMNSVRIGAIGILVAFFGAEQAEGFLHDFEGWVVFMICVTILFLEMHLLSRLSGRRLLKSLRMDTPPLAELWQIFAGHSARRAGLVTALVVVASTVAISAVERRDVMIPARPSLSTFPLLLGEWHGTEQPVGQDTVEALKSDDTLMVVYGHEPELIPVGLWVAYYSSQRGRSVHSPATCLPGGGWQMQSLETVQVPGVRADGQALPVNRAIIAQGDTRQLVYYWFAQRGRTLTNEYLVKWFIFWDGLTRNRTDGALIRLTTPVREGTEGLAEADLRLQEFARTLDPKLGYFLPQEHAVAKIAGNN